MKSNLVVATRVFPGWAALATLLLPAPLHGAQPGFPFAEDFQSQSLLSSTQTTARWTSSGVTLGCDGNLNGVVDALIGLAATAPPR